MAGPLNAPMTLFQLGHRAMRSEPADALSGFETGVIAGNNEAAVTVSGALREAAGLPSTVTTACVVASPTAAG